MGANSKGCIGKGDVIPGYSNNARRDQVVKQPDQLSRNKGRGLEFVIATVQTQYDSSFFSVQENEGEIKI